MGVCAGGIWDTKHLCKLHPDLIPLNSLGGAFERVNSHGFGRDASTALQVPCLACLDRHHVLFYLSILFIYLFMYFAFIGSAFNTQGVRYTTCLTPGRTLISQEKAWVQTGETEQVSVQGAGCCR